MKLQTLTLAAALAFAGSAFAANSYSYGHESGKTMTSPTRQLSEKHPMKHVTLKHHRRHHATQHVALNKMHKREFAFTRQGKEHLAASSHPQRNNS